MTRADDILVRMRSDFDSDWPTRLAVAIIRKPEPHERHVTEAEAAVLRCLAVGMGLDGTADLLVKSRHTVKSQLAAAKEKLRAKDTPHAVALAIRQGLIA